MLVFWGVEGSRVVGLWGMGSLGLRGFSVSFFVEGVLGFRVSGLGVLGLGVQGLGKSSGILGV